MTSTLSRRTFLKVGLAGTVILAAAGGLYRATAPSTGPSKFVLDDEGRAALGAIVGVILQGAIPAGPDALASAVSRTQQTIASLPLETQKEIQDLFGLLTLAPTRRFLVGISDQWSSTSAEEVDAFLQSWRTHRFTLLQSAYHALHDLILGAWYADESTWAQIGYPGPMKISG